jgi:hypothetical protein
MDNGYEDKCTEPVLKKRRGCSHHRVCEQTYIREAMFEHDVIVFVRFGPVEQDDPEGTRLLPSVTCFDDAFERLDSQQRKLKKDENKYWKLYSNLEMALSRTIGQSDETSKRFVVNDLPPASDKEEIQGCKAAVTKTLGQLGVALMKDTTW